MSHPGDLMPLTDLTFDEVTQYRPESTPPADFDAFWDRTLSEARAHGGAVKVDRVTDRHLLRTVEVDDVRFPGWNGEPVAAWLVRPRDADGSLPVVVTYLGYTQGRGAPTEHLLWSAAGYAELVVDSRGQGHDTPDRGQGDGTQWVEGFMSRGITSPDDYYYRRLVTDCVRAVDAVGELPGVDPERVIITGGSQGGGLTIAVAGLARDRVVAALPDVPFLCHFRRAVEISGEGPYVEIAKYLRLHSPHRVSDTFTTLSYFDGVHFAQRATAPTLFSVGMMDPICPPSTVYAAFNHYAANDRTITVWPFADHGGGYGANAAVHLAWLHERGFVPSQ
jgi:cephalosporin-C deacetylase